VDLLARKGAFGPEETLHDSVCVCSSEASLTDELSMTARRLVRLAVDSGLPKTLGQQIQLDIEEIGMALVKLLPATTDVIMKLEVVGENTCKRWHQDNYTGRAIVTYNLCGTQYTAHDNVNFWEFENGGKNDRIILDQSQVLSAHPGDILFMKGKTFPGTANGLVHKAPVTLYHPNGAIMNRLCLKVDVP